MNVLLSLFSATVYAAEIIISPLSSQIFPVEAPTTKPQVSFSQIAPTPVPVVLGDKIEEESPYPKLKKASYTIAFLGDSMIDTLGPTVPHVGMLLKKQFPHTSFTLINIGVGGENIDSGIKRITNDYTYLGNSHKSLVSQNPDIVVVESFGYNPYSLEAGSLEKHWMALATVVDTIKANLPNTKIVLAATISPNPTVFGDGAPGLSFSPSEKQQKVATIRSYLDSTIKFAQSQRLPIADVYHASLDAQGVGKLVYINAGDHIHYSDPGRMLFAETVTNTLLSSHSLE